MPTVACTALPPIAHKFFHLAQVLKFINDSFDSFDSFGDGNPSAVGSGSMELIEFSFGGKAAVEGDVFF
ncbi:hypothetical protein, partial [Candidatus Coxiella mudrowiae]|uniref:hypothetical protein n=1 Tax=Candidatus Coxiella mudrowiae TaxID=2054173 RepID=UPI001C12CA9D